MIFIYNMIKKEREVGDADNFEIGDADNFQTCARACENGFRLLTGI
jgi:hypothetical protein